MLVNQIPKVDMKHLQFHGNKIMILSTRMVLLVYYRVIINTRKDCVMKNYMKELVDKLAALGYVVSNVKSKIFGSSFSFDVNGTTIHVTDRELKDVDSVVEYVINHVDKEDKMKTVTETLKALVQDLDKIDSVVFGEHNGEIIVDSIKEIIITIDDFNTDGIAAHVMVNHHLAGRVISRKYEDLLEEIKSYLNGDNEPDEIGSELADYLKLDDYEINGSTIKINLPNNREMKIMYEKENVYNIAYQTKNNVYGNKEVVDIIDTWDYTNIKTDSVKNLAKIIVLKYIYNF